MRAKMMHLLGVREEDDAAKTNAPASSAKAIRLLIERRMFIIRREGTAKDAAAYHLPVTSTSAAAAANIRMTDILCTGVSLSHTAFTVVRMRDEVMKMTAGAVFPSAMRRTAQESVSAADIIQNMSFVSESSLFIPLIITHMGQKSPKTQTFRKPYNFTPDIESFIICGLIWRIRHHEDKFFDIGMP